jgi:hypothetical protein
MTDNEADADRAALLAELRERRRRVDQLLGGKAEASAPTRPPAGADDAGKAAFWSARFAASGQGGSR